MSVCAECRDHGNRHFWYCTIGKALKAAAERKSADKRKGK